MTRSASCIPRAGFPVDEFNLLGSVVDAGDRDAVALGGVEHEAAEAAPDVDHRLAGGQADLAAHMLHLVDLRLLEARRPSGQYPQVYIMYGSSSHRR
jgi:hypothetical protein